ncbi:MAG: GAF domain-containing protein, partial [Betaproteobacteria bacterium]
MRELSRRGLLGPEDGWSLAPVAAWLAIEGRRIADPAELANSLMARLDDAGAGIDRISISSSTLHPQMLAWGIRWSRVHGSQLWTGGHASVTTDAYIGSPAQYVRERNLSFRSRLTALRENDHVLLHELRAEGLTDYAAVPMVFGNGSVNLFTLATARPEGFSDADLDRFEALANLIAPIFEIIERRRMTLGLLDAFVGPRISARILEGQV